MTQFVDSFTTQQLLPPWQSTGARFWAFVVKTAPDCMQHYLDTHFNSAGPDVAPFQYRCRDDSGYGMLIVADHPDFSSGHEPGGKWSTLSHREVFWSFPAFRYPVNPDNLLDRPQPVWIQPFYFDDNSLVMFSSREIWGSEKQIKVVEVMRSTNPLYRPVDVQWIFTGDHGLTPYKRGWNTSNHCRREGIEQPRKIVSSSRRRSTMFEEIPNR